MFAFARDGGIPGHSFLRKVDEKRSNPVRTGLCPPFLSFHLPTNIYLGSMARVYSQLYTGPSQSWELRRIRGCD